MTHDSHDSHGHGVLASHPSAQGTFIGRLALGLIALIAVFSLLVLISAGMGR